MATNPGTLTLVGTPLGNLADMTPRAQEALTKADVIACEDTRRTGQLLHLLGLKAPKLVSFHKDNEHAKQADVLSLLTSGQNVVLVSDGGMPGISDPGAFLVAAVRAAGLQVEICPGPTAVTTAVAGSGFFGAFRFVGFPPRKAQELRTALQKLQTAPDILVFYESPNRVAATVEAMVQVFGGTRKAWLARELTKMHEEWLGPTLADMAATLAERGEIKGECVLVVEGAGEEAQTAEDIADDEILAQLKQGHSVKDVAAWLSAVSLQPKSQAYSRVQALKQP
jgi:16S rRNA (cytidine1402-2'-O)-methyltransferase